MMFVFGWFGLQIVGFIVLLILGIVYFDRRYKKRGGTQRDERQASPGFFATNEVFIDPADGLRYRVFYNPRTGEREYIRED